MKKGFWDNLWFFLGIAGGVTWGVYGLTMLFAEKAFNIVNWLATAVGYPILEPIVYVGVGISVAGEIWGYIKEMTK